MNFVTLPIPVIQQLIRHNKEQIKELDTQRHYLQHIIQLYYNSCDPMNKFGVLSSTAFSCLNKAKDELVKVKKKMHMLTHLQYQCKYAIR